MSTVTVFFNKRQATIKTTPGKSLSDVRTEACAKFSLTPASSYILKRNGTKLDLSLPMRLTGLVSGAKIDLVQSTSQAKPVDIVLRAVETGSQLTGSFPATTSIWGILKKFEKDDGRINITERAAPSQGSGSGRLLYQMPAVRVANRELAKFDDLRKTLQDLGCSGREMLALRFLPTEIPYEDALLEIVGFSKETTTETATETPSATGPIGMKVDEEKPAGPKIATEDKTVNGSTQASESLKGLPQTSEETTPTSVKDDSDIPMKDAPELPEVPAAPKVTIYQPSSSAIPAAATFEVPESAYEVGIAQLQKLKESYEIAGKPQRLLSDKELAEKEEAKRQEIEKINTIKIKVRYPDSYISEYEMDGKSNAKELYAQVRTTLRHPNEPFVLMIPPREIIKDDGRRLTLDLKLRSGASLHLKWDNAASSAAKNNHALKDEFLKASKELPKPVAPTATDYTESDKDDDKKDDKRKAESSAKGGKGDIEKKLKGLLRLGKK
ncbi:GLUT4 regulating protein TUG-domain-containing protein [Pyronema omphalodes]|nr:GLUT4 regulating protein TUG-domain-containing protein [Pyronema omphalodes]